MSLLFVVPLYFSYNLFSKSWKDQDGTMNGFVQVNHQKMIKAETMKKSLKKINPKKKVVKHRKRPVKNQ